MNPRIAGWPLAMLTACSLAGPDTQLPPPPEVDYVAVAVGAGHACGLATDGTALCWGDNIGGQLGTSDFETRIQPDFVTTSVRFAALEAGAFHTCGLVTGGQVYCWGANNVGQLGLGVEGGAVVTPDTLSRGFRFTSIALGSSHSCGVTTDSLAYCWGGGDQGQLGNNLSGGQIVQEDPDSVWTDSLMVSVTAGGSHSCGLTASGIAYCWGAGSFGQLGTGGFIGSTTPTAVAGGHVFVQLSAGGLHTCGVTDTGEVLCWGRGDIGQLGNGTSGNQSDPTPVSGGHTFDFVSSGGSHTCGRKPTNEVLCWGNNDSGQLGTGGAIAEVVPTPITGAVASFSTVVTGNASAGGFTCGRSAADGALYCWGRGVEGQLGDRMRESSDTPSKVAGQN